jgi:hypothetical protein
MSTATPVLYVVGAPEVPGSVAGKIAVVGTTLAWFGALLEAVADGHKLILQRKVGMTVGKTRKISLRDLQMKCTA